MKQKKNEAKAAIQTNFDKGTYNENKKLHAN